MSRGSRPGSESSSSLSQAGFLSEPLRIGEGEGDGLGSSSSSSSSSSGGGDGDCEVILVFVASVELDLLDSTVAVLVEALDEAFAVVEDVVIVKVVVEDPVTGEAVVEDDTPAARNSVQKHIFDVIDTM